LSRNRVFRGRFSSNMGKQRDIASFFGGGKAKKDDGQEPVEADRTNGAEKVASKRQRIESSSSDEDAVEAVEAVEAVDAVNAAEAVAEEKERERGKGTTTSPAADPSFVASPSKSTMSSPSKSSPSKKKKSSSKTVVPPTATSAEIDAKVTWEKGAAVPFTVLTEAFEDIADTTKRLEIQNILTATFRAIMRASPSELLATVYLCTNRVSPAHEGLELGLGDSTLIKALAQATGRKESAIKENLEEVGDLGIVAAQSRGRQKQMFKPKPLTVGGVLKTFREIAESEGAKSQDRKIKLIIKLLAAASENEAGYLMRALQGKLRIGLAEQTVLIALAHAKYYEGSTEEDGDEEGAKEARERAVEIVKSVYSECPSYDLLIPALLECADIEDVPKKVHFSPGIPVKPMLAKVGVVVVCCRCRLFAETRASAHTRRTRDACSLPSSLVYDASRPTGWPRCWRSFRTRRSRASTSTTASGRRFTCSRMER